MLVTLNNAVAAILTAYLTLTNALAEQILVIIGDSQNEEIAAVIEVGDYASTESNKPQSNIEGSHVDLISILANSAAFQEAAVIEADLSTTTDEEIKEMEQEPEVDIAPQPVPVEDALVNIYCTYRTDSSVKATTGTGFFVDENGVILTNAHVAMFFLLEDLNNEGTTKCVVRIGDPAVPRYYAELLYISPTWVNNNAEVISSKRPTGTGEHDYALLYVTNSAKGEPLPSSFPALPAATDLVDRLDRDNTVTVGGFPVVNIKTIGSSMILHPATATSSVTHIYTFGGQHGDLVSLRGTDIGQHGMSGGPVTNEAGQVIGLISTKGDEEENGSGSLNAITLSYIHRTLIEETGFGFKESVSGDLPYRAKIFRKTLQPFLTDILAEEL